jgi:diadenylate cyclase
LLFQLYKLLRGSVAVKIFLGYLFLYLVYLLVKAIEMDLLTNILGQFMGVGAIALLIVFQQEIRKFLLLIGKTTALDQGNFFKGRYWRKSIITAQLDITPFVEAVKTLGGSNTGALLVFAKTSELKFYADTGEAIDSVVSKRLLLSIFNKLSPLHDGAVIISRNRIKAARCILPVSENDTLTSGLGLRHRAALGMSESTDSVILVVSEETGQISIAKNGRIELNLSGPELREKLIAYLSDTEEKT